MTTPVGAIMPACSAYVAADGLIATAPTLNDEGLNRWLREQSGLIVNLVHARHRCKFFAGDRLGTLMVEADPDKESIAYLKILAKQSRLKRLEVTLDTLRAASVSGTDWHTRTLLASQDDVKAWHTARLAYFGTGRGKSLSDRHAHLVWHQAGGRCMYRGCGEDLGITALTTKAAAIAYLAHIVASDQDGPRGEASCSHALSDDPENVMLMCDQHHRLIDRIDVDGHDRSFLETMRSEQVQMVRGLLSSLKYPRTKGVALLADLANVKTALSPRNMHEAMLGRGLAPAPDIEQMVRRSQRDDRLGKNFSRTLLHEHELGILEFIRKLGSAETLGDSIDVLSVFPLHLVPMLVLCGKIIGEARKIEVFQYDRNRGCWAWDTAAIPHAPGAYSLESSQTEMSDEVLLSLELTSEVDPDALPPMIASQVHDGSVPWIRVRALTPGPMTIGHPADLEQFTAVARSAIRLIHEQMRAKRVHLLGVSPASTLFRFGQLLQAGHHPEYSVYDRPDKSQPFCPTLIMSGQHVTDASPQGDEPKKTIQLR